MTKKKKKEKKHVPTLVVFTAKKDVFILQDEFTMTSHYPPKIEENKSYVCLVLEMSLLKHDKVLAKRYLKKDYLEKTTYLLFSPELDTTFVGWTCNKYIPHIRVTPLC